MSDVWESLAKNSNPNEVQVEAPSFLVNFVRRSASVRARCGTSRFQAQLERDLLQSSSEAVNPPMSPSLKSDDNEQQKSPNGDNSDVQVEDREELEGDDRLLRGWGEPIQDMSPELLPPSPAPTFHVPSSPGLFFQEPPSSSLPFEGPPSPAPTVQEQRRRKYRHPTPQVPELLCQECFAYWQELPIEELPECCMARTKSKRKSKKCQRCFDSKKCCRKMPASHETMSRELVQLKNRIQKGSEKRRRVERWRSRFLEKCQLIHDELEAIKIQEVKRMRESHGVYSEFVHVKRRR